MANGLYRRMAVGNLSRNRQLYFPYFVATAVMSAIFFIITNTVFSQSVGNMHYGQTMAAMLTVGIVVMTLFTVGYMLYINSFLIKRRKKEFGLYGILGLEKRHVGRIILLENTMLNSVSLGMGLIIGTVFGKLAFMLLMVIVRTAPDTKFTLSPRAYLATAAVFIVIFAVNTVYNQLQVRLANPIDLIHGEQKGEKKLRGVVPITVAGVLCLGAAYYFSITVESNALAIMIFWPLVVLVILGTYALFLAGSQFLLRALRSNKRFYYKPRNFITVSGLIHRMKQNASGLSNICILCTMVLVTMSCCLSLYLGQETILSRQYPDDYSFTLYTGADGFSYDAQGLDGRIEGLARDSGVELERYDRFEFVQLPVLYTDGRLSFRDADGDYGKRGDTSALKDVMVLSAADYNAATGSGISLAPDEILIASNCDVSPVKELDINGKTYRVSEIRDDSPFVDGKNSGYPDRLVFVASDSSAALELAKAVDPVRGSYQPDLRIVMDLSGAAEAKSSFAGRADQVIYDAIGISGGGAESCVYTYNSIDVARAESYVMYGGLLFMGILFTLLFLTNTVLIMYFKQVSEGYEDRQRFAILQQVGMSDQEVRRTINRQVLIVFFAPLAAAICHILAACNLMVKMLESFVMTDTLLTLRCILFTTLAFAAVYIIAFRFTARTYYRLVRR